jgi:hypothetical protein
MSKIHQELNNRRDLNKIVLIDKEAEKREKRDNEAFAKSPNTSKLKQVIVHNCTFFARKNETTEQAIDRITAKFNNSIV